jgi:hypothetical protein
MVASNHENPRRRGAEVRRDGASGAGFGRSAHDDFSVSKMP